MISDRPLPRVPGHAHEDETREEKIFAPQHPSLQLALNDCLLRAMQQERHLQQLQQEGQKSEAETREEEEKAIEVATEVMFKDFSLFFSYLLSIPSPKVSNFTNIFFKREKDTNEGKQREEGEEQLSRRKEEDEREVDFLFVATYCFSVLLLRYLKELEMSLPESSTVVCSFEKVIYFPGDD